MGNMQATKEAIWLPKLIMDLGYMEEKKVMVIRYDNQGAISLTKIPLTMHEQNTFMYNMILFKNKLKMESSI
jgi:hypothetical protein